MSEQNGFTKEQQTFLQGFALGSDVARKVRGLPVISDSGAASNGQTVTVGAGPTRAAGELPTDVMDLHADAQDRQVAAGGKLVAEEKAKRAKPPRDMWDEMQARANAGEFPEGTDVFLTKFHGMFYVAPAQDSYMCRLRFPGGAIKSYQLRGLAELADKHAGGYADCTTRANLQLREIGPADPIHVLTGLRDLGIINYGAGGDNIRNVTASPLSGIDPTELVETLPLARKMHYYLLNHREFNGLPRKFNIAFDGGGAISALEDTNDIGFTAVRAAGTDLPEGVYFQLTLGGITGHKDFARPTGVLLDPDECVEVAAAVVRVFLKNGDRTNRNKARLKYVLDDWGFDRFVKAVEEDLGRKLRKAPLDTCQPRDSDDRQGHVGVYPQLQPGLNYVGVAFPVGRVTSDQMRGLAKISDRYGDGDIRLTVWQNLLLANIPDLDVEAVKSDIEALGLDHIANSIRAGLIACTGAAGCKYAAAPTKANALTIADYVEQRLELDVPVNIHLTGCHHSCAQHYIGDIGLIAANVENPSDPDGDTVEGYHMFVGGGYGVRRAIGRELFPALPFEQTPSRIAALLQAYLDNRISPDESFVEFTHRVDIDALREMCLASPALT
ncbi:Sulfite reductase [ferredoxin] [Posidoniimonas polymericola]|uniref:Sulfite reductase [ferredoxin] n=1 Tax=Posidoniimonas polymericola TaxID=2528002 RepID=A0A5C5YM05_9BACT|nr:NirA family protein [Posidoniimonas polymericola]TWT75849.1 Sulfite reductase [ferredoxin] [Posidoniimonas polymericola]